MKPTERTGGRRVELFVRDDLPEPAARQRGRVTRRLAALDAADCLDAYAVYAWDKRIQRGSSVKNRASDRYSEFTTWAREEGVSLRPFFGTRECYSMETGEFGEWVVFPALCLAVYEDDELAAVFPHADGEDYRSVSDGLDALASEPARTRATGEDGDRSERDEEERDLVHAD